MRAATDYERASAAMRRGDYAVAYCLLQPLGDSGDRHAQYTLGWMYHNGYGLAIDDAKSLAWWRKAAEQDLADASFALGMLFSQGVGGRSGRDLEQAVAHAPRSG